MNQESDRMHFILQGASPDTGNLGVSALLAGSIKCIREAFPKADFSLLEGTRHATRDKIKLAGGEILCIGRIGVRRNFAVWRRNHLFRLLITAWLLRLVFPRRLRRRLLAINPFLNAIASANCVADITGGDSFSDIYGLKRLINGTLYKLLVLAVGTNLVLLPQTYGPFKSRTARLLARIVVGRAAAVITRDLESIETIEQLMGTRILRAVPQATSDVAFILDSIPPDKIETIPECVNQQMGELIGFNISGLLYNGGYWGNNMFSLNVEYPRLVLDIARDLLKKTEARILLVPHVYTQSGCVENDLEACEDVFRQLDTESHGRVLLLTGKYDQSEIKYVIGLCSFFIGSRMHACIAATSQRIPTVPLAYSRKFAGLFGTIGAANLVADLRNRTATELRSHVLDVFNRRDIVAEKLSQAIPLAQMKLRKTFQMPLARCSLSKHFHE